MKLMRAKTAADVKLKGVVLELVTEGGEIHRIILRDVDGGYLEIARKDYSLQAFIPAPPEMKKVWKITGTMVGMEIEKIFDDEYEAKQAVAKIEGVQDTKFKIEEIEVEVK